MDYSAYHWSEKARKYAETLGTIFNVKGRVNTVADLPSTGNKIGDVYLVGLTTDTDLSEYAWLSFDNVTRWEKLGSTATSLAFSAITGSPNDNTALKNALDSKQDELPSQTGNNGKFLTTNGSTISWATVDALPSQTSQSGKFLTTNGTTASWDNIPTELPTQAGNNGKYLATNGTSASWANIPTEIPSQTGQSGKFLTTNGTSVSWETIPSDSTKANTSLSNLDLTGQAVIDGKVDLNASNLSTAGKSLISGLGLPSHTYDDLTLGVSDASYQAPANGWFVLNKEATGGGQYINMRNYSNGIQFGNSSVGAYQQLCAVLPCLKGDSMIVGYNAAGTTHAFKFVYAEGESNVQSN